MEGRYCVGFFFYKRPSNSRSVLSSILTDHHERDFHRQQLRFTLDDGGTQASKCGCKERRTEEPLFAGSIDDVHGQCDGGNLYQTSQCLKWVMVRNKSSQVNRVLHEKRSSSSSVMRIAAHQACSEYL